MGKNEYFDHIRALLGAQAQQYIDSLEEKPFRGIRTNTLKCADIAELLPETELRRSPFSPYGYVLPESSDLSGNDPLHHAGAFYFQEPSAMSAATVLDARPGEKVLDLCAAPGGKSTQIAAALGGEGLIWSNEVVRGRANILLSNMERMGVRNAVISSLHPEVLCSRLAGFFDKVLVDAPCSGEGMIRREPEILHSWTIENVRACAERQLHILESAKLALRPGGMLVYSTCTLSAEENEQVIEKFLQRNPDFTLADITADFGRPAFYGMSGARRILPADGGEGHFAAKLKLCGTPYGSVENTQKMKEPPACFFDFWEQNFNIPVYGIPALIGENVLLLPHLLPQVTGLQIIRAGVLCGKVKGKRFEPEHALFAASKPDENKSLLSFERDDQEIMRFLHGEEIDSRGAAGYTGVSVSGVMVGFGKASNGRLKNRYPKGLRSL